jgi:hypothetical protein
LRPDRASRFGRPRSPRTRHLVASDAMHGGTGAVDQQFTKIGVVSLANTTEPLFATCRTLFRDQTDLGNYDEQV